METKERIIQSATGLFLEKGYERTSVREIAKRADINLALMNYYFRSKEILFENIVNLLIGKTSGALKKILDSDLILEEKNLAIYLQLHRYVNSKSAVGVVYPGRFKSKPRSVNQAKCYR